MAYKMTAADRRALANIQARERQMQARKSVTETSQTTETAVAEKNTANPLLRGVATLRDLEENVNRGAYKAVEGIVDYGAGIVGAVGGVFSEDFKDNVKQFIETDWTGKYFDEINAGASAIGMLVAPGGNPISAAITAASNYKAAKDNFSDNSYLKEGGMIEQVAQGVGQMLPAVAISLATAGAAAPAAASATAASASGGIGAALGTAAKTVGAAAAKNAGMLTIGASAAGTSTEEAFKDGASYGQGMLYGAASGATEMLTERLLPGVTDSVIGKSLLGGAKKEVAEQGIKRVVKEVAENAINEAREEAFSEFTNPLRKSIYKGVEAFKEYADPEFYKGVGEAALAGAGTSVAFGGTVGNVLKGKAYNGDIQASKDAIEALNKERETIEENDKYTVVELSTKQKQIDTKIAENYKQIETVLKSQNAEKRAETIERYDLGVEFDENGTYIGSEGAVAGFEGAYYSSDARGGEANLKNALDEAGETAYKGDLSPEENSAWREVLRAHNKLNKLGYAGKNVVLVEKMPGDNALLNDSVILIGKDQLTNGKHINRLVHETTHFTEGSKEWKSLTKYIFGDGKNIRQTLKAEIGEVIGHGYGVTDADVDAVSEYFSSGYKTKLTKEQRTLIEEVIANRMGNIFSDNASVEQLCREQPSLAKRIWERIKAIVDSFGKSSSEREEIKKLRETERLFRAALETGGQEHLTNALHGYGHAWIKLDRDLNSDEIITDDAVVIHNGIRHSIKSMKHDIAEGQMFEDLKTYCKMSQTDVDVLKNQLTDLVEYMNPFRDILDLNETYGREGRRFSPYKPNSDPLYTISLDFSTQCSKRLLTQYVIEKLQLRENRPMSAEEQMAIRDMLKEYRKVEKGLQVACVMCYVEAARLKSPKQIQKWLDDPATKMRNYFADKNSEFSAYIKKVQGDFKESKGYDRDAPKKDMASKDVSALNKIRPKLRSEYKPSDEELSIIDRVSKMPNSTYLTAGNLAELSETHPEVYKAYAAFIRTATRSKALETDEPYYYGDSKRDNGNGIVVTDSFIESVNKENGMRYSSWSDWRIQHLLDWITAVIDNSVRGAAMHGYTKYGDEVRVLGKTGMMFNMSGVAGTQTGLNEDGSLSFSETESMDYDEAIKLREEFPETAGLQCIGVSDEHILALLNSEVIDYIIPYHVSGLNASLRRMGDIYGWKDYTKVQHATPDTSIKKEEVVDSERFHEEPVFSEFFVGYDTGLGGVEAMRKSAENYIRLCNERGLVPKFASFSKDPNYWKLLIDRKMVNPKTNTLIEQNPVKPNFDFKVIREIVEKYVENYDSGLEERAFNHIVENWDNIPKRIRDLKKQGSTKAKKAIDTLASEPLAVQPKGTTQKIHRSGKATIDNEGDLEYNSHREWAKDVLSSEDKKLFYEKIGEIKQHNREATFSDGKYLLDINNKLIITDADYNDPSIETVMVFDVDNATEMDEATTEAIKYAREIREVQTTSEFIKIITDRIDTSLFKVYNRFDFESTGTSKGESYQTRTDGYKDFGYSRKQQYGRRGNIVSRRGDSKTVTLGFADGSEETMSREEYDRKYGKKIKRSGKPTDIAYLEAVESGDMETAQRMVDEAAKEAGYDVTTYHGTDKDFFEFKTIYYNEFGYHVGTKQAAEDRVQYSLNAKVLKLYTKLGKTIRTPDVFGYFAGMHDYIFYVRGELDKVSDMDFLKYGRTKKFTNKFPMNEELEKLHNAYVEFVESGHKPSKANAVIEQTQRYMKSIGVESISYTNAYEAKGSTSYLLMDANQVKLADPVTYDDDGKVIPLSERFNIKHKDIRRSGKAQDESFEGDISGETIFKNLGIEDPLEELKARRGAEELHFPEDEFIERGFGRRAPQNMTAEERMQRDREKYFPRMTEGQFYAAVAKLGKGKVYTTSDASTVINEVAASLVFGDRRGKITGESNLIEQVWELYNASGRNVTDEAAYAIADYVIEKAALDGVLEQEGVKECVNVLEMLKPLHKAIDLSELKSEIREKFGKKNAVHLLWGKKEGGISLEEAADKLKAAGYKITSQNPIDILTEIHDLYHIAKEEVQKATSARFADVITDAERDALREDIAKKFQKGYKELGQISAVAKLENKHRTETKNMKQKFNEQFKQMQIELTKQIIDLRYTVQENDLKNRIVKQAEWFKAQKDGVFFNATQYKGDTFKKSLERIGSISRNGNLSDTLSRKIFSDLRAWYSKDNPILYTEGVPDEHQVYQERVANMLQSVCEGEGAYTIPQLKTIAKLLDHFRTLMTNYGKAYIDGKYVEIAPLAKKYVDVINEVKKVPDMRLHKLFSKYKELFDDPISLMRLADGYQDGYCTEMYEALRKALINAELWKMDIHRRVDDFMNGHKQFQKDLSKKTIPYTVGGVTHNIPLNQALYVYMTMNRKDAFAGHVVSGFEYQDKQGKYHTVAGIEADNPLPDNYTDTDIEERVKHAREQIYAEFNETEKEYISIIESIFNNECKKAKSETDLKRDGFTHVLDSYYCPVAIANKGHQIDGNNMFFNYDLGNFSFNKSTVDGSKHQLKIMPLTEVFDRHVRQVALYSNVALVADGYTRIFNLDIGGNQNVVKSVKSELKTVWDGAEQYIRELFEDIKGRQRKTSKVLQGLRGGYAVSAIGANPKVLTTQFSSLLASVNILDLDCITKGITIKGTSEVDKYCKLAELRDYDNSAAMAQANIDRSASAMGKVDKIGDILMKPIGVMDRQVVKWLFGSCQLQIEKNGGAKVGTEENKKEAGKLLEKVILETQQNSLLTERSAAMRSDNIVWQTFTMFRADAMKGIGRFFDAYGSAYYAKHRLDSAKKNGASEAEIKQLEADLKKAHDMEARAVGGLVMTSVYIYLIGLLFKLLYNKLDDEYENGDIAGIAKDGFGQVLGNMIGGLPIISDLYTKVVDGYDIDNYAYSAVNDLIDSTQSLVSSITDKDASNMGKKLRNISYSAGQILGVPVRNIYNVLYGLTKRISPEAAYNWDDMLEAKSYSSDLKKAIEKGDEGMISTIAGLVVDENAGFLKDTSLRNEMKALLEAGNDVLPRSVGESVTYNGEQFKLTKKQQSQFNALYSVAGERAAKLVKTSLYKKADSDVKSKALKFIYDTYYNLALQEVVGEELEGKNVLFAEAMDIEQLAIIVAYARSIEADKDRSGNSISGSKRTKIESYIQSLGISAAEKYMIMGYLGYKCTNGASVVKGYINRLSLTKAEKERLYRYCGYAA